MKTLLTSTALSLLLVGGGALAQQQDDADASYVQKTQDEENTGVESLPPAVADDIGTDVTGPDAATADEGALGGGRGAVATRPMDGQDDGGEITRFVEEYYDLGYRERDGYIWEDGEFLTDESGERVAIDRADEFERDSEGRFATDEEGRMMRRGDAETASTPGDQREQPGQTTRFVRDYYDLGYEERDGMLFEDGQRMTDSQDRPITTDTYSFYAQDDEGRLMTDDEGEFMLRDDAPEFSVDESGEMRMGES